MKRLGIIAFILALVLCFAMPVSAVKIFPYNAPLQDIVTWDKFDEEFRIANPENEAITVAWPEDVDFWNYDGDYWKYNLPDGDEFLFLKRVNIEFTSLETGGVVRNLSITQTVGAAGAIYEGIRSHITSAYMTGSWTNAIVGVITYSATGSAGGGIAAPLMSEMNMQPAASSGGSYYNVHSYFNVPTSATLIDNTSKNYAFELYELAGGAKTQFDLYGLLWHIVGLTDLTTKVFYNNTLKIQIDTTKWWIPLSEAEGHYRSSYSVVVTKDADGSTASILGQTTVTGTITDTSYIRGTLGIFINDGILNGDNIHVAGLHGQLGGSGDWTEVAQAFAIWGDSGIPEEGITGETALLGLTNNGAEQLDSAIYIRGNYLEGDLGAFEVVFTFDLMNWTASDSPIQNGGTGDKQLYTGGAWKKIRIDIDGTQYYMIASVDPKE